MNPGYKIDIDSKEAKASLRDKRHEVHSERCKPHGKLVTKGFTLWNRSIKNQQKESKRANQTREKLLRGKMINSESETDDEVATEGENKPKQQNSLNVKAEATMKVNTEASVKVNTEATMKGNTEATTLKEDIKTSAKEVKAHPKEQGRLTPEASNKDTHATSDDKNDELNNPNVNRNTNEVTKATSSSRKEKATTGIVIKNKSSKKNSEENVESQDNMVVTHESQEETKKFSNDTSETIEEVFEDDNEEDCYSDSELEEDETNNDDFFEDVNVEVKK